MGTSSPTNPFWRNMGSNDQAPGRDGGAADAYDLVIDARTPAEWAAGRLPGSINLPVWNDEERAQWANAAEAQRASLSVACALRNVARHIDETISALPRYARLLVYSQSGSLRTKIWADALQTIGYRVEILPGGFADAEAGPQRYAAVTPSIEIPEALASLARYRHVIDARSEREYEEDRLPGARSLPVAENDEYAEVGTLHRFDPHRAYIVGVSYSLRNIAAALERLPLETDDRALVYCFRGGKRSRLWTDALTSAGVDVVKLVGGWKAYRRWINAQLVELPGKLRYRVLCGPTGCGKTRLLQALRAVGAQVLDLEEIARHRGSLMGALPGVRQPSQKLFDSLLIQEMRRFDPSRPVWLEAESKKIGALQIPASLHCAMHASPCYFVDATMPARVGLWRQDYDHFERDPLSLIERLRPLRALVGGDEFDEWERLARGGRPAELFERLMTRHYDPVYARTIKRNYPHIDAAPRVVLPSLEHEALRGVAQALAAA